MDNKKLCTIVFTTIIFNTSPIYAQEVISENVHESNIEQSVQLDHVVSQEKYHSLFDDENNAIHEKVSSTQENMFIFDNHTEPHSETSSLIKDSNKQENISSDVQKNHQILDDDKHSKEKNSEYIKNKKSIQKNKSLPSAGEITHPILRYTILLVLFTISLISLWRKRNT